ncbi:MAG: hypothetical protein ACFFE8_16015 [Candidatus Heimdallarchaeota archaeon]
MSFLSQVVGTFTFQSGVLREIAESEDLTKRGWILFILSSLISGLFISVPILQGLYSSESHGVFRMRIPFQVFIFQNPDGKARKHVFDVRYL